MYELARKIGHRGLAARAPENTLAGIRAAHSIGLRWVEVDIRLSADGVAMLSHDATLQRCGGQFVRLSDKTAAQLNALPVPCGFEDYANECVPTLADSLLLLDTLNMSVVLEIKPDEGNEIALARSVQDVLRSDVAVMVSSYSVPVLHAARAAMPTVTRAINCIRPTNLNTLRETAAANLHCGVSTSAEIIHAAATAGFGVYCFTTDSPSEARRLLAAGAQGIFTNTGLPDLK